MLGEKLIRSMNFRKLRRLCRRIERTGSVYLSGESLGIPRTSLQDLLTSTKEALEAGIVLDKELRRARAIFKAVSVSHARWAINTLEAVQYGGLASARRSTAVLYLLQTFKPLDFPKYSVISSSENALQLIATLRAIGQATSPAISQPAPQPAIESTDNL